ncbi:hypothetical protein AZZ75_004093 [Klebsiella pneumoniae]|nr:hypothetical protein AZZ75_004093 [Klebsiella pneumoniae]
MLSLQVNCTLSLQFQTFFPRLVFP